MHKLLLIIIALFSSVVYANEPIYSHNYNDALILSKTIKHKILLIFSADWCVNCEILKKDLITNNDLTNIIICVVDTDNSPEVARSFKIRKIPVSILLDNNHTILSKYTGYSQYNEYISWLKANGAL